MAKKTGRKRAKPQDETTAEHQDHAEEIEQLLRQVEEKEAAHEADESGAYGHGSESEEE